MPRFNFKDFTAVSEIPKSSKNIHPVSKGTLVGSNKYWYCKRVESKSAAFREAIAQEFFRLIIPYQPETRIAYDKATNSYYILSEEVKGFNYGENYFRKQQNKIGFGKILLLALFLEEDDLKFNNLGLDEQNRVIKIDGGLCFHGHKCDYKISAAAIEKLPYPEGIKPRHWLDIIKGGVKHSGSFIVDPSLSSSIEFRNDVNQAILAVCLLPDSYIERFVNLLTDSDDEKEMFIKKLKDRRDELTEEALENISFVTYLKTEAADQHAISFVTEMLTFKSGRMTLLKLEEQNLLMNDFVKMQKNLFAGPQMKQNKTLIEKIKGLVDNPFLNQSNVCFMDYVSFAEKNILYLNGLELNQQLQEILNKIETEEQKLKNLKINLAATKKTNDVMLAERIYEQEKFTINDPNIQTPIYSFWQKSSENIEIKADEKLNIDQLYLS